MAWDRAKRALLNPRGVGNLRAVEKELKRLRRFPTAEDDPQLAIERLERFRAWYVKSLKERTR